MNKILFVCLGNICRSPLAEGLFRHHVTKRKLEREFEIDSCGTGSWHVGDPPHRESIQIAQLHNIDISQQQARQLQRDDSDYFDLIVAMDRTNKRDIEKICGVKRSGQVVCLREYDHLAKELDVPDPYYGGPEGFVEVYEIVNRSCEELLNSLL